MKTIETLWPLVRKRFSLWTGKEAGTHTITEAKTHISFQWANLWILLLAVVICSIGLNINSTPVVIGAMLLSPLMGPIIGLWVGLAIFDTSMVWKGLRNLMGAFLLAIIVSGLYFFLSPLQTATPEILARTSPAIWDILIAIAWWVIGAIALTRKEKWYTIIPGVAIATALMPPLCAAWYWLVQGDIIIMFKTLYLLFINTIYIAGATFLVARFLHLPKKEYPDMLTRKKVEWLVWSMIIITAIPWLRLTKTLLDDIILQQQFTKLSQDISQEYKVQVLQKTINTDTKTINIWLIGSYLNNEQQTEITNNIIQHSNLQDYKLIIRQGVDADPNLGESIVKPLLDQAIESQESQTIAMIQQAIQEYSSKTFQPEKVLREAQSLESHIQSIGFEFITGDILSGSVIPQELSINITTDRPLSFFVKNRIEVWIRTRIQQVDSTITWILKA